MKVFKFGGACIQNPEAVRKLGQLIKGEQSHPLVIVVSALGTTTKGLEDVLQQKLATQPYDLAIQRIYRFHQDLIDVLLSTLRQEAYQTLVLWQNQLIATLSCPVTAISLDRLYSKIVAEGELLASRLIYYHLQEQNITCAWLDARRCIKTHSKCCNAQIDWITTERLVTDHIDPLLQQRQIVLTQGFIGSDATGETTTLGREGSDFTGAILASVLGAQSLTIWKDVSGVMSADPKLFKKAIKFDRLTYKTMAEMAFYGAKVVHPKTIQPLATHNIPLCVRPLHAPHEGGTEISHDPVQIEHPIHILQNNQGLLQLSIDDFLCFDEACEQEVLSQLIQCGMHANMLVRNAYTLSVCFNADLYGVKQLIAVLKQKFKVNYHAQVALLTIMHPNDDMPQAPIQQNKILLAQQSLGIYQVVLQHATALATYAP